MWSRLDAEWLQARQTRGAFMVGVGILLACLVQGFWAFLQSYPLAGGDRNAYVAFVWSLSGPQALWPLFLVLGVALLGADSLAWDRQTGFGRFAVMRTTRTAYARIKWWAPVMMAGAVVAGLLLMALIVAIVVWPDGQPLVSTPWPPFAHQVFARHPFWYCIVLIGYVVLAAMSWVSMTVWIGALVRHVYVVLLLPWVLSFVLTFILERVGLPFYAPWVTAGAFISFVTGPLYPWWLLAVFTGWLLVSLALLPLWYRRRDLFE